MEYLELNLDRSPTVWSTSYCPSLVVEIIWKEFCVVSQVQQSLLDIFYFAFIVIVWGKNHCFHSEGTWYG